MALATYNVGDGILTFVATNTFAFDRAENVDFIVITATAIGAFAMVLGATPVSISNSANNFTRIIPMNRHFKYLELTSGPTGAVMYVFLKKK